MRCCYSLITPPIDTPFHYLPPHTPFSLFPPKKPIFYPTRISFGSCSFKPKATLNGGHVAALQEEEEEASQLSFYELLGIPLSGSMTEIKQAYKQLARKYHPDVSPPGRVEEYTKRFIMVQEAYETLSDPRRRAMYDSDMARGIHLAFSARSRYHDDDDDDLTTTKSYWFCNQVIEQKSKWKSRWQSQLSELKRRSESKDAGGNLSWAARMRQQKAQSSNEL
ncbi:hypothetical protein RIF29_41960 [Crotalaria pallida]|uniref:J domain-containing protein n=1 Tax=Crotalaria pallida TaxID=3830 RepID=A0AAN9HVU8_CROPI